MKKFTLLAVLFHGCVMIGLAQTNYRPGFIIKTNNDTLKGLILYTVDGKFDELCTFKRFEIARKISYGPGEIKAFGFRNGRYFESKPGERTFYECIVKGDVSVYIRPGKPKGSVYLESSSSGFFKLSKGSNRLKSGESFTSFSNTLAYLLNKSGSTEINAEKIDYNVQSIAMAARKSSESNPARSFYPTKSVTRLNDFSLTRKTPRIQVGVNAGYHIITPEIEGTNLTPYFKNSDFDLTNRPVIGIYFNSKLTRKSDLVSIDLTVNYLTSSSYGYAEYTNGNETSRDDIIIDFSALHESVALKLSFGKNHIHPYFKAGAYISWLLDSNYSHFSEQQSGNEINTENFSEFFTPGNELGLLGSGGLEFDIGSVRRICLEASYLKGNQSIIGKSDDYSDKIRSQGVAVMLRMNF